MSAKKLAEFISQVKNGSIAKPSHYLVELNKPLCLEGQEPFKSNLEKIALFCDKTEIPGVNLDSVANRSYGETREVVYDKKYDQLQMSFYVDNNFIVKQFFDSWIDCIFDPKTRHLGYYRSYITQFRILVQDSEDKDRYVVTLHEVYPKTIAPIQLSYDSKDIIRLNVTFTYKYATYERYGYVNNVSLSPVDRLNQTFNDIRGNGIIDTIAGGLSNFNYGFGGAIPEDYFSSFSSFQESISVKASNIFGGFFSSGSSGSGSDGYSDLF